MCFTGYTISFYFFDYFISKIITKIIVEHLKLLASHIVSPHQAAFIKGNSILIALFGTQLWKNKVNDDNLGIKLDITKGFDMVRWALLIRLLQCFGFSNTFPYQISILFHLPRLYVLFNVSPKSFFHCSRGVRQQDPLSAFICFSRRGLEQRPYVAFYLGRIELIPHPHSCQ